MNAKRIIKDIVPPIFLKCARACYGAFAGTKRRVSPIELTGNYASWAAALADSSGYEAAEILKKTRAAMLKVRNGEAVYERDSVVFEKIQYSWPVLAGLMWAAAQDGGELNVLDYGGALGSSYFQNKEFLGHLSKLSWDVIEQSHYVQAGQAEFQNDVLRFHETIDDCLAVASPNAALLSSVLQYVENPLSVLNRLANTSCRVLVIDRTPFWAGPEDRICVQHVPEEIYEASYPSWIFSYPLFKSGLEVQWDIIAEFDNADRLPGPVSFGYKGFIALRK